MTDAPAAPIRYRYREGPTLRRRRAAREAIILARARWPVWALYALVVGLALYAVQCHTPRPPVEATHAPNPWAPPTPPAPEPGASPW